MLITIVYASSINLPYCFYHHYIAPVKTMSPSEHQQSAPVGSGVIAAIAIFSCCFLLICSILIVWAAFVCCKSRRKHSLAQTQEQENRVVHCNNLTPTSTTVGHNGSRSASLHLQAKRSNVRACSLHICTHVVYSI